MGFLLLLWLLICKVPAVGTGKNYLSAMAYYYTYLKETGPNEGISQVFTNLQGIVDFDPDLSYNTLLNWFSRKKKVFWREPYAHVMIIKSHNLVRGKQRVVRQDVGHNRNI